MNDAVLLNLHKKSREFSIKTRSTPASLLFKGQATSKHTAVKWPIGCLCCNTHFAWFFASMDDWFDSALPRLPIKLNLIDKLKVEVSASDIVCYSKAFKYMASRSISTWSTVLVIHCDTGHADLSHSKTEILIKAHCLPLETSSKRSAHWWILPQTKISAVWLYKSGPGCSKPD